MNEAKLKDGYLNIGCKDIREKKLDSETELNADVLKQNNRTNEIYHELLKIGWVRSTEYPEIL